MINNSYIDLLYERQALINKKSLSADEIQSMSAVGHKLTAMEKAIPSKDIIESIREAFKHIPARN